MLGKRIIRLVFYTDDNLFIILNAKEYSGVNVRYCYTYIRINQYTIELIKFIKFKYIFMCINNYINTLIIRSYSIFECNKLNNY